MDKLNRFGPPLVRIGLSLVFLWFGFDQLLDPGAWTGYVPAWAGGIVGSATTLVLLNGWLEVFLGFLMLIGFQTRWAALILGLHLAGIASSIGLSAVGVRDWGLVFATFSIFLAGSDPWCVEGRFAPQQPVV